MQTNFSSQEDIEKSKKFFAEVQKPQCTGCTRGISMCYNMPCLGTVEDIEKIMDAGFSKNLMLDWWVGTGTKEEAMEKVLNKKLKNKLKENTFYDDVAYLVPAIKGLEGKKAPFSRHGECNLLVDNMCSLHNLNLKPIQGRTACCSTEYMYFDKNGKQVEIDTRIPIIHTWNTQRGVDLIERWKKEVNFTDNDTAPELPTEIPDIILSLFEMFKVGSGQALKETNCPKIDYENPPEIKVFMYDKPY